jgi:putative nucleotidyltransferase with HDIG domain
VHLSAIVDNQFDDPDLAAMIITAHEITVEVEQLRRLAGHQQSLVAALGRAAEFRDPYTAGHQLAVADISRTIAVALGLAAEDVAAISLGASIHDIGKIAVPAEILSRPGGLSVAEYEIVKTHCQVGRDILGDTDLPPQVADAVLHHHERLDGSGYPDHLMGKQISLAARIVAVADVLDAMVSHRPYRAGLGLAAARAEIRSGSGARYDPDVVAAALLVTPTDRDRHVGGGDPATHRIEGAAKSRGGHGYRPVRRATTPAT